MDTFKSIDVKQIKTLKNELTRFMMTYKFALDELNTKIDILKQEFHFVHDYNPIEHVSSRIKTPESILKKVQKKGYELNLKSIKENIQDIAGVRITCSFISDIYELSNMLSKQQDIKVLETKDYISNPKTNGYRSLHLILEVPVFMSDREEHVCVEVQIRTIAMDFWTSLEHKIYYKYNRTVPKRLVRELTEAAESAAQLDRKMERIHKEMNELKEAVDETEEGHELWLNNERFYLPNEFLKLSERLSEK
ncbi:GTP pyrophosphokinase family protein [Evansella clarkii]|uniref:GTP pyrophosphokinase n=1 Tax=Evansella clarkii TaxID=79879 RepID=UPI000B431350|nr:GTP pyrophosphokinase family protein [Evansella clarkii]